MRLAPYTALVSRLSLFARSLLVHRTLMYARRWSGSVFAFVVLVPLIGCDGSSSFCRIDEDCSPGLTCDTLLSGGTCIHPCSNDADCSNSEFCDTSGLSSRGHCARGCKSDRQCASGKACYQGECVAGCHVDEQCPQGHACILPAALDVPDAPGACRSGCRTSTECEAGSACVCNVCVPNGCTSNDDCSEGFYCPGTLFSLFCASTTCAPLPPNTECGMQSCNAEAIQLFLSRTALKPCCAGDTRQACGFDLSTLVGTKDELECQVVGAAGNPDKECPASSIGGVDWPGCRRPDGMCGVSSDEFVSPSLGCVLVEHGTP
jgi:hypothetical protein